MLLDSARKQTQSCRPLEGLHSIGDLKLLVDVIQVEIDGSLADEKEVRDLLARMAFHDERKYLDFSTRQSRGIRNFGVVLAGHCLAIPLRFARLP